MKLSLLLVLPALLFTLSCQTPDSAAETITPQNQRPATGVPGPERAYKFPESAGTAPHNGQEERQPIGKDCVKSTGEVIHFGDADYEQCVIDIKNSLEPRN